MWVCAHVPDRQKLLFNTGEVGVFWLNRRVPTPNMST